MKMCDCGNENVKNVYVCEECGSKYCEECIDNYCGSIKY